LKFLDLFKAEITLKKLFINDLKSAVVLYENQKFNFTHILDHLAKNSQSNEDDDTQKEETSSSLFFAIESFSLNNTQLSFEDITQNSKAATTIDNLSFKAQTIQENGTLQVVLDDFDLQIPVITYKDNRFDIKTAEFLHTIKKVQITQNESLNYLLDTVVLSNKKVLFIDQEKTDHKSLSFTNLMMTLDQVTNAKDMINMLNLSFDTPTKGNLSLSSDIILQPLSLNGDLKIKEFTLVPYKNYIKDFINLDIKSTHINTNASFKITDSTQKINADLTLSDVSLYHAISKEQLLDFDTLDIKKIDYTNNNLIIDKIILDTFTTQFKIKKDTTTNMDNLVVTNTTDDKEKSQSKSEDTPSSFEYYIKSLELKNGEALYSDHQLPLNFDTNIHTLRAKVEDLSSKNEESSIVLKGVVEKYGVANIKAKSILANFKEKTDVTVNFENLDVRSFSPYSGKFIGQKIQDGRLWLKLDYQIKDAQLMSTNNIKLKDLTLGEDVESPDAMSLPVGLAIALLEDSDGLIDVDVPITGDMQNPEFELSGVIWKTLGNIITNVVTAPFSFLGSLLGLDSDELGKIEFHFASAKIHPPQKEKLDQLIGVLQQKEALIITLVPSYDLANDSRVLKERKFKALTKSDNKEIMIQNLYIEKFGQEKYDLLSKDENIENLTETLSQEIKETITISKIDLQALAMKRVENLQEYFVSNKLTLDRIQIKNEIIEDDSSSDEVFILQLQLNIKDN